MTSETQSTIQADEAAIRRVLYLYCRAVDRADGELMRAVYHDDAIDDHGSFRLPVEEAVERILESTRRSKASQHNLTNIIVDIDGSSARSEAYAQCQLVDEVDGGERLRMLGLRYLDRLERRAGEWRILERRVVHDWSVCLPVLEPWGRASFLPQGSRDGSDPVYATR